MFVVFLIFTGVILTAGPCHLEGGCDAIQKDGFKPTISKIVKEHELPRKTYNN